MAGSFVEGVRVQTAHDGVSRSATAAVTVLAGPIDSIALEPDRLKLRPMEQAKVSALAFDAYGNAISEVSTTLESRSEAGRIDSRAMFTAGTNAGTFKPIDLTPGVYVLRLDYSEWTGAARLRVDVDSDVPDWDEVTQCHGGCTLPTDRHFALYDTARSQQDISDQFGIRSDTIIRTQRDGRQALLIPTSPRPGSN
ncbi:MAG: hypothetical protein O3A47_09865 [Chloroflexi bacterium]|nr:hypothetical protein [Chloroflexota bacterium]